MPSSFASYSSNTSVRDVKKRGQSSGNLRQSSHTEEKKESHSEVIVHTDTLLDCDCYFFFMLVG